MAFNFYALLRFWRAFKEEAPDIYKQYNKYSFFSVGGFPWIDYALSRRYKNINNIRITKAGDLLCKAYLGASSVITFLMLMVPVIIGSIVIWVLINNGT